MRHPAVQDALADRSAADLDSYQAVQPPPEAKSRSPP